MIQYLPVVYIFVRACILPAFKSNVYVCSHMSHIIVCFLDMGRDAVALCELLVMCESSSALNSLLIMTRGIVLCPSGCDVVFVLVPFNRGVVCGTSLCVRDTTH